MTTYRWQNKKSVIFFIVFLIGVFIFVLHQMNSKEEAPVGDILPPMIKVEDKLYGTTIDPNIEITDDYTFYGHVKSAVKKKTGYPKNDLEVTYIIENTIGYKVYRSKDKEYVAVFNEETQRYDYFCKL